ncbi:MAG: Smr/MutS family protein [Candidatus Magasanikbacteria bacterium]
MDPTEAKIFAAGLNPNLSCLDLHGLYPMEALERLELFLYKNCQAKIDVMRVVYGGGTGKLKLEILSVLRKHPLVDKIHDEGGSVIILL